MKQLIDILTAVQPLQVTGDTSVNVTGLHFDSRKVEQGSVFIAVKGTQVDGHEYIEKAIAQGAVAIVAETIPADKKDGVVYVQVKDSASAAGLLAAIV